MTKAKLLAVEERDGFHLQWFFGDEDGGYLGQDPADGTGPAPEDRGDFEHWAASKAIREAYPEVRVGVLGFVFDTATQARTALRIAQGAAQKERPLPEWARTAMEAGWKPPKGWKP